MSYKVNCNAKKKKKPLDPSLWPFVFSPIRIPAVISPTPISPPGLTEDIVKDIIKSTPDHQMSIGRAWLEYTGVPSMIGGGLGALGFNVAFQAGQVKSGTSMFTAARFGFGLALLLEASIGTAAFATILTILDPQDLHAGGLTNEPIGKTLYDISPTKQIEETNVPSIWKFIWASGQ
jgi:hypothetical protein